jgi:hypothetical protein
MSKLKPETPDLSVSYDPAQLVPAPELTAIPMLGSLVTHYAANRKPEHQAAAAELREDLTALHASFDEHGILDPLKVTLGAEGQPGLIWDGRHRHEWALAKGLKAVPIKIVTKKEGQALMTATVAGRRHWTKGQRAWLAVKLHPELLTNRTGPKSDTGSTREQVAALFGVSLPLLEQAIAIGKAFAQLPSLAERHEPGIWAGFGLGAILAGIPGAQTTAGQPRAGSTWTSLAKPLGTLTTLGKAFVTWSAEDRTAAQEVTQRWLQKDCPPEFRAMLKAAVSAAS